MENFAFIFNFTIEKIKKSILFEKDKSYCKTPENYFCI